MSKASVLESLKIMLIPAKYGLMRWSYTLQRISGVAVSLYFVMHVLETGNFIGGITVWSIPDYEEAAAAFQKSVAFLQNPIFDVGLAIIGFLVAFHSFNGVRLLLTHFGLLMRGPGRPEPFSPPGSFSNLQKALFWVSLSLAVFALLYTLDSLLGVFRS